MKYSYLIVFLLCCLAWNDTHAHWYRPYCRLAISPVEAVAYDLYKEQVDSIMKVEGYNALNAILTTYMFSSQDRKRIAQYIKLRELRKATYRFIDPVDTSRRRASCNRIDAIFQDSIDALLIKRNDVSGKNITKVIRSAGFQRLGDSARYALMHHAIKLCQYRRENSATDLHRQEIAILRQFLSERNLEHLVGTGYQEQSDMQAREIWHRLKMAHCTARYDSTLECGQISNYLQKKAAVKSVYSGTSMLSAKVDSITRKRPDIYRLYLSIMKVGIDLYSIRDTCIVASYLVDSLSGNEQARNHGSFRTVYEADDGVNHILLQRYAFSDYWDETLLKPLDTDYECGDFEIIEITNRQCGKTIHIEYDKGWARSHCAWGDSILYPTSEDCFYATIPVSSTDVAYLFFNSSYGAEGYATIVLSTPTYIAVVFQKSCIVKRLTPNTQGVYDSIPIAMEKPADTYSGGVQYFNDAVVVEDGILVYKHNVE